MSGWRSRLLDSAGGGGIWRGRELRDGGRRCQRWFGELLPVSFVRIDRGGAGMMGGRRKLTRFSSMAGLSAPSMSFWAAEVNSARPDMGRYSWLRLGSLRRISSAFELPLSQINSPRQCFQWSSHTFLTTGKTHGFALLSRYAPIPRSTFFSKVSLRYAVINPKSGSSGACGTLSAVKTEEADPAMCPLMLESLLSCVVIPDVSDEVDGAEFKGDISKLMVTKCQRQCKYGRDYGHY